MILARRFCRHMDKVSPYTCAVRFTLSLFQNASARWLRKFLRRCSTTFTCLESTVYVNQWDTTFGAIYKKLELSGPGIQHLKLVFEARQSNYLLILNCVFSTCQPTLFF
ncbi:hypothetical protein CDL15_Pgr020247 [Punica granatum]|uniref:Uncharacterized protein n=1 Tax=Punica granatum TaxID=22663 RepID=A0A218VRH0_PUNGR|nr:hypothetical protein CDL15_Pgr020247 [Punica granatum]